MGRLLAERSKAISESGAEPLYYLDKLCTVCLLVKGRDVLARGVAIRSPLDPIDVEQGRLRAYGRAGIALVEKRDSMPVVPRKIHRIEWGPGDWVLASHGKHLEEAIWDHKAYYQPAVLPRGPEDREEVPEHREAEGQEGRRRQARVTNEPV